MRCRLILSLLLSAFALGTARAASPVPALALELFGDGEYKAAALEFRRQALASDGEDSAPWYWMGAYSYASLSDYELADRCVDRAEEVDDSGRLSLAISELRADIAYEASAFKVAAYYYGSLYKKAEDPVMKEYAAQGKIASLLFAGETDEAAAATADLSEENAKAASIAVASYKTAPRKKPWLGGLLGMIPGCGHFYSGEYANGIRSMILNGLFIYGMVQTARDDSWGAFAAISFFEITWYSGSIYGGVDAAERYNNNLLLDTVGEIRTVPAPRPDIKVLPVISFQFEY